MKKKMKGYNMGGFTMGAGDGDITPRDANMNMMAKGGGLMGFMNGGGVMDGMMKGDVYGNGGGTKRGGVRKTARRAYTK
tara:strand:- start:1129 stop:1365 length:237 start_codon:yes stop_codon:yes gene_type:complete